MEKAKPTHSLVAIKAEFSTVEALRITVIGRTEAARLGIFDVEIIEVIQSLTRSNFYKSMTTLRDHTIWQDVYHVGFRSLVLYVKFSREAAGHIVVSFKEK